MPKRPPRLLGLPFTFFGSRMASRTTIGASSKTSAWPAGRSSRATCPIWAKSMTASARAGANRSRFSRTVKPRLRTVALFPEERVASTARPEHRADPARRAGAAPTPAAGACWLAGELYEEDKRKFGYSRDKRGDCVQVIIALIVTPEGFPLAGACPELRRSARRQHQRQDHPARFFEKKSERSMAGRSASG